jgi:cysteine-rich repeat protein
MPGLLRKIIALLMASLLASWLVPKSGNAHGEPAKLAFWGNFPPAVAECQRQIGHAAALCVARVVRARGDCRLATESGGVCDEQALGAEITAARAHARGLVRATCSEQEVQNLRYLDVNETLTDVIGICRSADTAAESAIFDAADSVGAELDPATVNACLAATRAGVGKVLAAAMRERRMVLDRIAAKNVAFGDKQALIDRSTRRVEAGIADAAAALERECPPASFMALYGRGAAVHIGVVATQADCFAGAVFVQDAVVCPPPVCGNAVREQGEACEDGNTLDGDGCDASCHAE